MKVGVAANGSDELPAETLIKGKKLSFATNACELNIELGFMVSKKVPSVKVVIGT